MGCISVLSPHISGVQLQKTSNGMSCWPSVLLHLTVHQQALSAGPLGLGSCCGTSGKSEGAVCAVWRPLGEEGRRECVGQREPLNCTLQGPPELHPSELSQTEVHS